MPYSAIAERLGLSARAVRRYIAQALFALENRARQLELSDIPDNGLRGGTALATPKATSSPLTVAGAVISDAGETRARLAGVAEDLQRPAPKMARLLEDAAEELLAFMAFPREHWSKLRSTNPLERVNREIGRISDVIGIYPNDAALIRLAGALALEQNDFAAGGAGHLSVWELRLAWSLASCAAAVAWLPAFPRIRGSLAPYLAP